MAVGRPRVRCLAARLTTLVVRSLTLLPMFTPGHSRPMQSQLTNVARSCQMYQSPKKLDCPNSRPFLGLHYLLQEAHHGQFWTSSALHWTKLWMTKKFAVGFPTWAATFLKKQDGDNKRSRCSSKTKSLDGRPLSRKRTSVECSGMSALCQKRTLCSAAKSAAFNTPGAGKRHELFFAPFASEKCAGGPGLNWRTWNRAVGAENTTCSLLRPQSLTAARTFVGD